MWLATVNEYKEMNARERFNYRFYRHPFVTFLIGPFWLFMLTFRFFTKNDGAKEKQSVIITNVFIALFSLMMASIVGWKAYLIIHLPMLYMAQIFGVWMFYVQHQYEGVYWERKKDWDYFESAMKGSSFFKLPKVMQWFTGNIGFHHIHHLSHSIPNYNLERCMKENEIFQSPPTLTLLSSIKCMFLSVYDEDRKELISFKEMDERYAKVL